MLPALGNSDLCSAAYSGPTAPVQQVLHLYQHSAEVSGIYLQQKLKANPLPAYCVVLQPPQKHSRNL